MIREMLDRVKEESIIRLLKEMEIKGLNSELMSEEEIKIEFKKYPEIYSDYIIACDMLRNLGN